MKSSTLALISGCFSAIIVTSHARIIDDDVGFRCNGEGGECAEIADLAGAFQFDIDVTELTDSQCVESPKIPLNDLNWTLNICMGDGGIKMNLSVFPIVNAPYWTTEIDATIILLTTQANWLDHGENWKSLSYSNVKSSYSAEKFLSVSNFQSHYVKDKKATFDVELSMTPLDTRSPTPPTGVIRTYEKLYFKLKNLSQFRETVSSNMTVQGVKWSVHIEKSVNNLVVSLVADQNDFDENSSYKVVGVFKILSFDSGIVPIEREFTHNFGRHMHSIREILLNLKSNQSSYYVQNECANIVVEFKVQKSKIPSNLNSQLKEKYQYTESVL